MEYEVRSESLAVVNLSGISAMCSSRYSTRYGVVVHNRREKQPESDVEGGGDGEWCVWLLNDA